jgi:hypothetical protein
MVSPQGETSRIFVRGESIIFWPVLLRVDG